MGNFMLLRVNPDIATAPVWATSTVHYEGESTAQKGGKLVVQYGGDVVWSSGTAPKTQGKITMIQLQDDCDLVMYLPGEHQYGRQVRTA